MISMKLSEVAESLHTAYVGQDTEFVGCNTDSRRMHAGELFIALKGERFDGHDFIKDACEHGACAAIVEESDNEMLPMIVVKDTRSAMGTLAQHWRSRFAIPLVAITGSNGKTTVKEMLTAILRLQAPVLATQGNMNNEIGVPLTLFGLDKEHCYAIVEMGANNPGEIAWLGQIAQPTVALITQCAPAHLEGFESLDGVAKAKAEIYESLDTEGVAIINADDDYADLWRDRVKGLRQFSFVLEKSADVIAKSIHQSIASGTTDFVLSSSLGELNITLPLLGRHNVLNALAAATCSICLEIDPALIKRGLENVGTVQGRLEFKPGLHDSQIIDDTYNANPASLNAAISVLSGFQGKRWLVLGDMGELGSDEESLHGDVGETARAAGIERLYAIGILSHAAVESFGSGAQHFQSIDQLITSLRSEIGNDVTVLVKGSRAMHMERVVKALEGGK